MIFTAGRVRMYVYLLSLCLVAWSYHSSLQDWLQPRRVGISVVCMRSHARVTVGLMDSSLFFTFGFLFLGFIVFMMNKLTEMASVCNWVCRTCVASVRVQIFLFNDFFKIFIQFFRLTFLLQIEGILICMLNVYPWYFMMLLLWVSSFSPCFL